MGILELEILKNHNAKIPNVCSPDIAPRRYSPLTPSQKKNKGFFSSEWDATGGSVWSEAGLKRFFKIIDAENFNRKGCADLFGASQNTDFLTPLSLRKNKLIKNKKLKKQQN